jgi:hypothetical protein
LHKLEVPLSSQRLKERENENGDTPSALACSSAHLSPSTNSIIVLRQLTLIASHLQNSFHLRGSVEALYVMSIEALSEVFFFSSPTTGVISHPITLQFFISPFPIHHHLPMSLIASDDLQ